MYTHSQIHIKRYTIYRWNVKKNCILKFLFYFSEMKRTSLYFAVAGAPNLQILAVDLMKEREREGSMWKEKTKKMKTDWVKDVWLDQANSFNVSIVCNIAGLRYSNAALTKMVHLSKLFSYFSLKEFNVSVYILKERKGWGEDEKGHL